jgi:hypothetical protein
VDRGRPRRWETSAPGPNRNSFVCTWLRTWLHTYRVQTPVANVAKQRRPSNRPSLLVKMRSTGQDVHRPCGVVLARQSRLHPSWHCLLQRTHSTIHHASPLALHWPSAMSTCAMPRPVCSEMCARRHAGLYEDSLHSYHLTHTHIGETLGAQPAAN